MEDRYDIIRGDLLYKTVHTIYNDVKTELSFEEINMAIRYSHPDIIIWLFRNNYKNIKEFDSTFTIKSTITFDILDKAIKKYCTLVNQNLEDYKKSRYYIRDIALETDTEKNERARKTEKIIKDIAYNENCSSLRRSCLSAVIVIIMVILFLEFA